MRFKKDLNRRLAFGATATFTFFFFLNKDFFASLTISIASILAILLFESLSKNNRLSRLIFYFIFISIQAGVAAFYLIKNFPASQRSFYESWPAPLVFGILVGFVTTTAIEIVNQKKIFKKNTRR